MKLTDDELSLVLSENAAGKLDHCVWRHGDCGCVAGAVLDLEPYDYTFSVPDEAFRISSAISEALDGWDYPSEPEEMLSLLAKAGL